MLNNTYRFSSCLFRSCLSFHSQKRFYPLTADTTNPFLQKVQYAVRGEIVIKAGEYEQQLKDGKKLPFNQIIYSNIGNPQQLLQKPITFHREVLSLIESPWLLEKDGVNKLFAPDVISRAKNYLSHLNINGTGPYSHSQGVPVVRDEVAKFIEERDGYAANPSDIYLTNGASAGVDMLLRLSIRGPTDGIMIPIPQYPLYSATIPLYNGTSIPYYLDEVSEWNMTLSELKRSYEDASNKGVLPRGLVVINPGNPTGQCLSESCMKEIIEFCVKYDITLMADEVYQENIYGKTPFNSFRKVVFDQKAQNDIQMVSFHSISKGFLGECGKRGGYFELMGFDKDTIALIYKGASISLCSNVTGQIMMGLSCNPPKKGEPSFKQYNDEKNAILSSLKLRAEKLVEALNKLEGVSCQPANASMYAFPSITLPPKAIQKAKELGKQPDMYYCLELLKETGICVVPGSGFGQKDGTFHFRTTFLPKEEYIDEVNDRMTTFHKKFMATYN